MNTFTSKLIKAVAAVALAAVSLTSQARNYQVVGGNVPLVPTAGTVSFYEGYTWQGNTRSVLFIRPSKLPAGKAAAIVMLHYDSGTPELQANLSKAGSLAASMGYWVILPPAINGHWNDDPSDTSNTTDDVGFLKNLITSAVKQYPIDATRVSMAGLSNGGFMTIRMACEQPQLLASGMAVAAEMGKAQVSDCRPSRPVPFVFVDGTSDNVVPYNGNIGISGRRDVSAPTSFSNFMGYNACNTQQTSTQKLKVVVNDGTSVTLQHNASCTSRGEADLYTVTNGGHAWPGGQPNLQPFGTASGNLNTTAVLGNFAKLWTTKSTI